MQTKTQYVSPKIEVYEMEHEGMIATSNFHSELTERFKNKPGIVLGETEPFVSPFNSRKLSYDVEYEDMMPF